MKLLIVVALGLLPFVAAYNSTGGAIRPEFLVKLEVNRTLEILPNGITRYDCLVCSGVFIAEDWILTAANCIFNANFVTVYAANHEVRGGITIDNRYFHIHPEFIEIPLSNNVALIQFPRERNCGSIRPVMWPSYEHNRLDYNHTFAHYFKFVRNSCSGHSEGFSRAQLQVVPRKVCQESPLLKNISPEYLCVNPGDYELSCDGDVAGPLLMHQTGELIGIMSSVRGFCHSGNPVVFTRIDRHAKWIATKIVWNYFANYPIIKNYFFN